ASKLHDVLSSCGFDIEQTSDEKKYRVTFKSGASVTLEAEDMPRYIQERISPKNIREFEDYIILRRSLSGYHGMMGMQ
ncbi:MAG: hypothetical protein QGF38_06485, partial [Rhodospirillales bacterium]|nr:hypothetical protein [Rhodospirillales bacterium]